MRSRSGDDPGVPAGVSDLPTLLEGRYAVLEELATGGQARILLAFDQELGTQVAIKTLREGPFIDPAAGERLEREGDALSSLADTAAVHLLGRGRDPEGTPFLVLEYLKGVDLETRLTSQEKRGTVMSWTEVQELLNPVVPTLERAHQLGLFHRDLKPANLFLLENGGLRLIDFGYVHISGAHRVTQFGTVMGSPCYIAPEIWKGGTDNVDQRADVYSLAVIVFRMFAGYPPFESSELKELAALATKARRPSLHALRPDLSPKVDAWVDRALQSDPDTRYQSVQAMWEALEQLVHAVPSRWERLGRTVMQSLLPKRPPRNRPDSEPDTISASSQPVAASRPSPPPRRIPATPRPPEFVSPGAPPSSARVSDSAPPSVVERHALMPTPKDTSPPTASPNPSSNPSLRERRLQRFQRRPGLLRRRTGEVPPRGIVRPLLRTRVQRHS